MRASAHCTPRMRGQQAGKPHPAYGRRRSNPLTPQPFPQDLAADVAAQEAIAAEVTAFIAAAGGIRVRTPTQHRHAPAAAATHRSWRPAACDDDQLTAEMTGTHTHTTHTHTYTHTHTCGKRRSRTCPGWSAGSGRACPGRRPRELQRGSGRVAWQTVCLGVQAVSHIGFGTTAAHSSPIGHSQSPLQPRHAGGAQARAAGR